MKMRFLLLAAALVVAALMVAISGRQGETGGAAAVASPDHAAAPPARHAGKSHVRKPVDHRIGTAVITRIDHDWGFAVLALERGKFAEGHVGYLDRRGENGGTLRIESVEGREAVANVEQIDSRDLWLGDLVVFSPDLVMLPGYNLDLAQVEWFSE